MLPALSPKMGSLSSLLALSLLAGHAGAQAPRTIWTASAHTGAVEAVAFSPDGRLLATAGADHTVKLWRSSDGAFVKVLAQYYDEATTVAFSPDGTLVASGSIDRNVQLTDAGSGTTTCFQVTTGFVRNVAFTPDGNTLAAALGYSSNEIYLFDVAQCQLTGILAPHWGTVWTVAYSPEGSWLASGGADGRTLVMRASDQQLVLDLGQHVADVSAVVFTADGKKVASCGASDYRVFVWKVPEGSVQLDLAVPGVFLHALDISGDGRLVAAAGEAWPVHGEIVVWRLDDGARVASYAQGVGLNVPSIAFAPDGRSFAFGRDDGVLVLAVTPPTSIAPR
jgi:WD40 repeat protein